MIGFGYWLLIALTAAIAQGMARLPLSGGPETLFGSRLAPPIRTGLAARSLHRYRWVLWALFALIASTAGFLAIRPSRIADRYLIALYGTLLYTTLAILLHGASAPGCGDSPSRSQVCRSRSRQIAAAFSNIQARAWRLHNLQSTPVRSC